PDVLESRSERSRVDGFLRTRGVVDRLCRAVRALHDGAWLGFLDPPELSRLTVSHYAAPSSVYLDEGYNAGGLFRWEQQMVDRFFGGCRSIVVAAAGGGREVIGLARRGIRVVGFDCSAELVARARQLLASESTSATMLFAPPDEVPDAIGEHDGAIVGYRAYPHIFGRAARQRFLRKL